MWKLPPKMETIILMVYGQGFKEVEVAKELGISKQAVNKALKEARGRLAEMFLSLAEILNADITRVNVSKGYAVLRLRQLNESAYAIYVPGKGLRVLFERNIDPKERKSFYQEIIEATVRWGLIKEYKGLRQALNKIINIMES